MSNNYNNSLHIYMCMHAKSLQSFPTLCDPIDGSPPGSHPWDSPGKNTGVGCHFLLQCMKAKSESEVAQSCLTLWNPVDCSPPGSSVHGKSAGVGAIAFSTRTLEQERQLMLIVDLRLLPRLPPPLLPPTERELQARIHLNGKIIYASLGCWI